MGHWGMCPTSSFGNCVHSAAAASLTVKISKITKEKHVLQFRLSHKRHAKTRIKQIKTVSELEKNPGQWRREKIHVVPPHLISWRCHCRERETTRSWRS